MSGCLGMNGEGQPCGSSPYPDATDGRCLWHSEDPKVRARATQARSRGGKNTRKAHARYLLDSEVLAAPKTIEDLRDWAHFLVWAIATGRIDPRTSDSVTRAIKVAMDASDGSDLRDRLAELEATLAEVKRSGMRVS